MTQIEFLYARVRDAWGDAAVYRMVAEECSELAAECLRHLRGRSTDDDLASEIADVMIMLEQLMRLVDEKKVYAAREKKLRRLSGRLLEHDMTRLR